MASSPNKLSQFWQELKRRKVIRVISVYAAAAFVILELVDIISEPLKLPSWLLPVVIVLLSVGFIISVIISWIYDIHPEGGMVKTEPADQIKTQDISRSSYSWKIASYISFVVIVALIILNIIPRAYKKEIPDKSIAVLPFRNDSPDETKMYFINGTMEAILDNLSKIKDLRVPGRTSVEQYRDITKSIPAIAEEMNVSYILEGSGHRDGNNVRLVVQLLDGKEDRHLWSRTFEADIEEIFSLQSEIAQMVAAEIEAIITPAEKALIEKAPTASLTSWDFYQRGREEHLIYWMDQYNREALERAEELYHEALNYDSTFAQAYSGLASVYRDKNYWGTFFSEYFLDSVLILADKALSFDPQLSDAYTVRGDYYRLNRQIELAISEFEKAIQLNPNDWLAYYGLGKLYFSTDFVKSLDNYYKAISLHRGEQLPNIIRDLGLQFVNSGFMEKARYYYLEALKLDGDSLAYFWGLARSEFDSYNFEKDLELRKKIYAIDSTHLGNLSRLGITCMFLNQTEEALKYLKKWYEGSKTLSAFEVLGIHRIGWAYWQNGYREEAEYYFDEQINNCNKVIEMRRMLRFSYREFYDLAAVYAFRGDKDRAIENLKSFNKLQVIPGWMMPYIRYDPFLDSIRDEPEFQQIVRDVEAKYQAEHERVRQWLEENNML